MRIKLHTSVGSLSVCNVFIQSSVSVKRLREFLKGSEIDPRNVERSDETAAGQCNVMAKHCMYTYKIHTYILYYTNASVYVLVCGCYIFVCINYNVVHYIIMCLHVHCIFFLNMK